MRKLLPYFSILLLLCSFTLAAQNSSIEVDNTIHDYGDLENIFTLKSEFILTNNAEKNLYFLRADVDKDMKVLVYKKTLKPGDTTHLEALYQPSSTGRFKREIKLITSADGEPYILTIKGNIKSIKKDDKTACYYFGKPNKPKNTGDIVITTPLKFDPKDPNKGIQMHEEDTIDIPVVVDTIITPIETVNTENLNRSLYKPNNIVFVVDVSGSMKDSSKLPLMKKSLLLLIENMRDIDKVTFITYADSILLKCEAVEGSDKKMLSKTVNSLKANGYTRGAKAVLFGLETAKKNYIEGGNNQVFLATDGKFAFYETHYKIWLSKSEGKNIVLSVVALGNDKDAMTNLKDIARFGKGSFIRIRNFENDKEALIEEIKLRSKRN
ncbi:MAG: VWA domain-containing protein [Bacteroidota bacterium]|nr:VWA domain-containing protein [Bacteroidota bacterium]